MTQTCAWFDDGGVHCQEVATQRIVTDVAAPDRNDWLFCDQHTEMVMQEIARSPLTVSALAHRVDNA
jgi:hypothetical protein